jgi:hypothetical protein
MGAGHGGADGSRLPHPRNSVVWGRGARSRTAWCVRVCMRARVACSGLALNLLNKE